MPKSKSIAEREYYIPAEVAAILGCDRYLINIKAKAGTLPFPCYLSGEKAPHVKIPKKAFDAFMERGGAL